MINKINELSQGGVNQGGTPMGKFPNTPKVYLETYGCQLDVLGYDFSEIFKINLVEESRI